MHPLDNPATRLLWKVRDIHHRHANLVHNILAKHGLHAGQPRILYVIGRLKDPSQREIAQALNVSPASLATSIKRMQKVGLLEKVSDPQDMRVNKIRITPKGEKAQRESFLEFGGADRLLFSDFTPQELEQLEQYLERIYQKLSKVEESVNDQETDTIL